VPPGWLAVAAAPCASAGGVVAAVPARWASCMASSEKTMPPSSPAVSARPGGARQASQSAGASSTKRPVRDHATPPRVTAPPRFAACLLLPPVFTLFLTPSPAHTLPEHVPCELLAAFALGLPERTSYKKGVQTRPSPLHSTNRTHPTGRTVPSFPSGSVKGTSRAACHHRTVRKPATPCPQAGSDDLAQHNGQPLQ
jgi:hypothetical protein